MGRRALALLAVAIVAGCGADADARAEYIRQADALCRETMRYLDGEFASEFDRLDREADRTGDLDRFFRRYARLLDEAADRTERHNERIAALEPPPGSEELHAGIVRSLREQQELFRQEVSAYREGRYERAEELAARSEAIDEHIERVAREYGFVDCARPG